MPTKTQLRLAQLTGSLDDSVASAHPSAITDKSLQGVLDQVAAGIKRLHGGGQYSTQLAGHFSQNLHVTGSLLDFNQATSIETAAGALTLDGTAGVNIQEAGTSIIAIADNRNLTIDNAAAIDIDGSGAVSIDSTAASITMGAVLADGQTLKLGKNGAVEVNIAPHGTAANELFSVTNTSGDADNAIEMDAVAGGIKLEAAKSIHLESEEAAADSIQITAKHDSGGIDLSVGATPAVIVSVDANSVDIASAAQLNVDATTESSSVSTGALVVDGGVGIAKDLYVGDDLNVASNAAVINLGSDQLFTITHANANNTGLVSSNHRLAFGDAGDYIAGDGTDLLLVSSADVKVTGDLIPSADDTYDLGTTSAAWQDLHLEGDVLMTDAGMVTTAAGNLTAKAAATLVLTGTAVDVDSAGVLALDGLGGVNLGTATSGVAVTIGHATSEVTVADNLTVTGDLTVNGATTTVDTANLLVKDPVIVLGQGAQALNSNGGILFTSGSGTAARPDVAFGRVDANAFGIGSIANPNSGSITTVAGMTSDISFRADSFQIAGSTNQIDIDSSNIRVVAAADIKLDPAGGEVVVDGNLVPDSDSADSLGASGTAWANLYVDAIDLNGQGSISMGGTGRIDLDADDDTSIRASADDVISFEAGGADVLHINNTGVKIADDKSLVFGDNNDVIFEYDEDGNDVLNITGATLRIGDDQQLQFGAGGDAGIEYDEDGTDQLRIHQPAAGVVIAGTNPKLVIGDAGAEDTMLVFDGNAQDFRMGLDDGTDKLEIGVGAAHGTTTAMTIDASQQVAIVATTAASSTTSGALTVAGGASVAADLYVGDDLELDSDGAKLGFGADSDVSLTHVHDTGLLLNGARQLQFGDANTRISQVADSVLHYVADGQHLFDGGGSIQMHASGTSRIGIVDNQQHSFVIGEGNSQYLRFDTRNSNEKVFAVKLFAANANIKMNQNSNEIQIPDSQASALEFKNASGAQYLLVNTANSFVGTPDNIQLGAGTGRDFTMSHNGTNSELANVNGILQVVNRGGNLILSASAANAELQFGDAYCGNIMNGGLLNLADSAAEWNNYVSNFANNKSLVGALNSLASGGTRGKFQVAVTGSHAANIPLLVHADLNHDQGSGGVAALDVFVNGQLLTSGTAIANGDYKIGITSADHIQFFFPLESGDQVTVVKP